MHYANITLQDIPVETNIFFFDPHSKYILLDFFNSKVVLKLCKTQVEISTYFLIRSLHSKYTLLDFFNSKTALFVLSQINYFTLKFQGILEFTFRLTLEFPRYINSTRPVWFYFLSRCHMLTNAAFNFK